MKGLHDFIIELKNPLNATFKTESGVELYANENFSVDRLSNRVAKVISAPIFVDTPIKDGYEVMIEPTILYKQSYKGVRQHYTSLIDNDNMWFKVTPNMIILYRKNENEEWRGYLKNVMVEQIKEEEGPIISKYIIHPESAKKTFKKGRARLLYSNVELEGYGAKSGDELIINPLGGVNFWIEGKPYWWLRNVDVWAVAV